MPTENNIFPFYNQKDSWHITDSFKPKKHTQMQFKKENILKAHKEGCEDVKKFIELAAPELFPKEKKTYKAGEKFKHEDGDIYKLRTLDDDGRVALICILGDLGYVWKGCGSTAVQVRKRFEISVDEFNEITDGQPEQFTLIED